MKIILMGRGDCFLAVREKLIEEKLPPLLIWNYGERMKMPTDDHGIPWLSGQSPNEITISSRNPHLLVLVGYPKYLPAELWRIPTLGTINMHPGRLPAYRGRHSVNWALLNGEKEIGITIHYVNEVVDGGDIILQDTVAVERNDTCKSITKRITPRAASLVVTAIKQIKNGCAHRRPQDGRFSSSQPKRTPSDSRMDWSLSGEELTNHVRALILPRHSLGPNPDTQSFHDAHAWAKTKSKRKIWFYGTVRGECPGEVLGRLDKDTYVIATKDCPIVVKTDSVLRKGQVLV